MRQLFAVIFILASITSTGHAGLQPLPQSQRDQVARETGLRADSLEEADRAGATGWIAPGDKGPLVLRAQILLARAAFSPGEIDAVYGLNLRSAIRGFEMARQLPADDRLGPEMWAALNKDSAPVLMPYEISAEDTAGPFQPIPPDMMAESKLQALGYQSPLELLGEKFHVSPKVLMLLNGGKDFGHAGESIIVPNIALTQPLGKAAAVVVSKSNMTVSALDEQGAVIAQFPATMGSTHDPLPLGTWKINGVKRDPDFHYNPRLFWDANPKDAKATIAPGPNNPVGLVWIDLSIPHYGIHGTPEPSQVGHAQSHGCIRLTNWDALLLAAMVKPGVQVVLKE